MLGLLANQSVFAVIQDDYYSCSVDAYVAKLLEINDALKKHEILQPPYLGVVFPGGKVGVGLLIRPKYVLVADYIPSNDPYYILGDVFSKFENTSKALTSKFDESLNLGIIRGQYMTGNISPISNYSNICMHDANACKPYPDMNKFIDFIRSYSSLGKINSVKFYDPCSNLKVGKKSVNPYYSIANGNEILLYSKRYSRVKFLIVYSLERRVFIRSHFSLDGNSYEYTGLHPDGKVLPSSFEIFKY